MTTHDEARDRAEANRALARARRDHLRERPLRVRGQANPPDSARVRAVRDKLRGDQPPMFQVMELAMNEPTDSRRPGSPRSEKLARQLTSSKDGPESGKAELHRRIAAHARRLMVEGRYSSINVFADRVGLAQSYVHQVLKGERTPGFEFMVALHRGLGVDANELLDNDPPRRWFQPLECHLTWEPKLGK